MWACLHRLRHLSAGVSHRASSLDLSCMSCTLRTLPGLWHPTAWAFTSMRIICSSTEAVWLLMRKRYWDWFSVPSKQSIFEWRQTGFGSIRTKLKYSIHLVWYKTATREAELRLTVIGVTNSSVRHTRLEPQGHPWQWAANGRSHLTAMLFVFFQLHCLQLQFCNSAILSAIRHSLTQKSILMLVHSFICNRIDYRIYSRIIRKI